VPSFSFLIPTAGRPVLKNCLQSIVPQLREADEVIVIGDTLDGNLSATEQLIKRYPGRVRYLTFKGQTHTWGHEQMNYGISHATGDYLVFNDDDDIWVPGMTRTLRSVTTEYPGQPLLFRYLGYFGYLSWVEKGLFQEGYVGGHSLVCPNNPEKLGTWTNRYEGDWDFVEQTVSFYDTLIWRDEVIAVARPDSAMVREIARIATA